MTPSPMAQGGGRGRGWGRGVEGGRARGSQTAAWPVGDVSRVRCVADTPYILHARSGILWGAGRPGASWRLHHWPATEPDSSSATRRRMELAGRVTTPSRSRSHGFIACVSLRHPPANCSRAVCSRAARVSDARRAFNGCGEKACTRDHQHHPPAQNPFRALQNVRTPAATRDEGMRMAVRCTAVPTAPRTAPAARAQAQKYDGGQRTARSQSGDCD